MASMRDIKRRKGSIQSTGQITKAMKLVSTVKLQKAKGHAQEAKPYFHYLYEAMHSILKKSGTISHPMLSTGGGTAPSKKAVIVITSNRGLAGGYNANVVKLLTKGDIPKDEVKVFAIGTKGRDTLSRGGYQVCNDYSEVMNEPLYSDAVRIGRDVMKAYTSGEVGEIYLAYTVFKNTVTHIPTLIKLLPISGEENQEEEKEDKNDLDNLTLMNYEPEPEEVLDKIIPKYINGIIYGALIEAVAAENGARMQAMDNATNNAEDMIADLSLKYNRARQGSITQELTEIVAGASAIE
ncbi:MAG: ATP synthase F1 subunit gamma [Acetivibrio sp.]